jgi:hypothetical protein
MEFMKILFFKAGILVFVLCCSCSVEKLMQMKQQVSSPYEQITFIELMRKYMDKDVSGQNSIEGIYSVSASALKKGKGLFSSIEKEKTIDQKDNYAMVAIIRDNSKNNREYIEVPIDEDNKISYPIRGELTAASEGNILTLRHFEPKGKVLTYTLAYDYDKNIIEGVRTESSGSTTRTYKIVYLKMYPKPSGPK